MTRSRSIPSAKSEKCAEQLRLMLQAVSARDALAQASQADKARQRAARREFEACLLALIWSFQNVIDSIVPAYVGTNYCGEAVELEDVKQAAYLGVAAAVERFDQAKATARGESDGSRASGCTYFVTQRILYEMQVLTGSTRKKRLHVTIAESGLDAEHDNSHLE